MRLILLLLLMAVSTRALNLGNIGENLSKKVKETLGTAKENLGKVKPFLKKGIFLRGSKKQQPQSLRRRQTEEIMDSIEENGQRTKRQAFKDSAYPNITWLEGVVFYRFDESADYYSRKVFEIATRQWQEASCIDFTWDKDNKAENSIVLIKEQGCWSYVGRVGGNQPLSLGDGCDQAGIAAHELGHTLGLFHTMSRYDRDTFMTPVIENVEDKSAQCQNGGFPHPRNGSECICPSGYGGALCNERPKGCGQTYMAKETRQYLIDRLGFPSNIRDEFPFCNHWIEAPEGKKIEVKISSIPYGFAHDGCILGGVEIKSNKDQIPTGYRFCLHNDRNTVLVSGSNRVPVITFNRFNQQQVILEYKIAS
ncbi:Zinc metalloproteinase [Trichostrongylus colubriformis]|uniref:Zinc metalloproteinase n=1 Tax=Trichostrongylus colubriformis TaxID=6319 RepID=A0AAN8FNM2_TRICO